MEESNEPINRSIHISIDNLEDIIMPRLSTLTPAQWTLLSQGLRDSHITGVMADILTNIFQQCVENSLTVLVPILEENMMKSMKSKIPDENISVHLINMISTEMATVLEVPQPEEVCESSVELNSLMEQEVSEKVTSIANGIRRTSSFPSSPAVFAISESITEIIEKYSDDAKSAEDAESGLDHLEVNEVADGISKTIIDDLHYCKAEGSVGQKDTSCLYAPHFNLKKILGDIRNLFRSKSKTVPPAKEEIIKKPQFSRFAKDQFITMTSSLESSVRDPNDTNVVKLKRGRSLSNRLARLMFPGYVPEESAEQAKSKVPDKTETDQKPKLDFQSIKPQFDRLCAEFMENPQLNDRIKQFSKELTDKLYTDITSSHHYKLPVPPENLSESVLSSEKISDLSGQREICPEIFYARTEDEVKRFLQNIFLWIRDEETNRISESDRVSNVLSEISDLVGQTYETQIPKVSFSTLPRKSGTDSNLQTGFMEPESKFVTFVQEITTIQIEEPAQTPEELMRDLEIGTACFVFRAVLNCSKENGGCFNQKEMRRILRYLSGERIRQITDFSVSMDNDNNTHFVRNLYEDLKEQFGSAEELQRAAMSPNGKAFQKALEAHLKSYIPKKLRKSAAQKTISKVSSVTPTFFKSDKNGFDFEDINKSLKRLNFTGHMNKKELIHTAGADTAAAFQNFWTSSGGSEKSEAKSSGSACSVCSCSSVARPHDGTVAPS
ncbi:hypothetical protein CCH79_00019152 [Gambusia affinis]|uniref:Uncharacterized protein n=1 Tax=Gambusia affinis TaxID=33528 RepID=A0A315VKK3_GAMAF|nr:hypothetical protein CCH79_00019152 [Gambusia affinis]